MERNFGSFGADWESKMVKEFGNNTEDFSEGGLGRCKGPGLSSALGGDTKNSSGSERIPRRTLLGLRPGVGYSPCELDNWDC